MKPAVKIMVLAALVVAVGVMMKHETIKNVLSPRGIRNHNPGNIRRSADNWQGLSPVQNDPQFFQFIGPEWGIRAMMRILVNYQDRHGLNTIRGIISRWAPPNGVDANGQPYSQNTESYIQHIARAAGVGADDPISVVAMAGRIVPAMIRHENGQQPYSDPILKAGIELGGGVWA